MKRIISLILAVLTVLSLVPFSAFAEGGEATETAETVAEEVAEEKEEKEEKPAKEEKAAEPAEEKTEQKAETAEEPVAEAEKAEEPAEEAKEQTEETAAEETAEETEQQEETPAEEPAEETEQQEEISSEDAEAGKSEEQQEEPTVEGESEPEATAEEQTEETLSVTIDLKKLKDATVADGMAAFTVKAEASDGSTLAYQWQQLDTSVDYKDDADRAAAWADIEGENEATLKLKNLTAESFAGTYAKLVFRCIVTAVDGTVATTDEVKVLADPEWAEQEEQTEEAAVADEQGEEAATEEAKTEENVTAVGQTEQTEENTAQQTEESEADEAATDSEQAEESVTEEAAIEGEQTEETVTEKGVIESETTAETANEDEAVTDGEAITEQTEKPTIGETATKSETVTEQTEETITEEETEQFIDPFSEEELPATEGEADDTSDIASGTCGDNLTWVLTDDGVLTISGTGEMGTFSATNAPWYSSRADITEIQIGSDITNIEAGAFYGCSNVTTVSLSSSLETIENYAFSGCTSLTQIIIPAGVITIGNLAFSNCSTLTSVVFMGNAPKIAANSFTGVTATALHQHTAQWTDTEMAQYGGTLEWKLGCGTQVCIPAENDDGVEETCTEDGIGSSTYCPICSVQLSETYVIPARHIIEHVTDCSNYIEHWHCTRCNKYFEDEELQKETYESSVSAYMSGTTGNLTWKLTAAGILEISGEGPMPDYKIIEAGYTNKGYWSSAPWIAGFAEINTFKYTQVRKVIIGENVTYIGNSAFYNCTALSSIIFKGESISSIGSSAFCGCSSLTSINFRQSPISSIGNSAFSGCNALESVTLSSSTLSDIGSFAFSGTSKLTSIDILSYVKTIGEQSFANSGLTSVIIPASLTSIGSYAFLGCQSLKSVHWLSKLETIPSCVFYGCTALETISLPNNVTKIESGAFINCTKLKLVIPQSVKSIEGDALKNVDSVIFLGNAPSGLQQAFATYSNDIVTKAYYSHDKNWTEDNLSEQDGKVVWYLSCGLTLDTKAIDPSVSATCTKAGLTEGSHCSVCGNVIVAQEVIPALGHAIVTDEAVTATCTESGLTEGSHCTRCGEALVFQEEISATGHTPVTDVYLAPNCSATGLTEGSHCSTCNTVLVAQEEIAIDPDNHASVVTDEAISPTCITTGFTEGSHCADCLAVIVAREELAIDPDNHASVATDEAVLPTCTEPGLTEGSHCEDCGIVIVEQQVIPALGHTPITDETVASTCIHTGLTEGSHCSVCNEVLVEQEIVPIDSSNHTNVVTDAYIAPTCTEAGITEGSHCGDCGIVIVEQQVIPALGHTPVTDVAEEPSCTGTGLTEGSHCSVCNMVLVAQERIPALGHTPVTDEAVAPTCTETGLTEGSHCSVCDVVLVEQQEVPALGHTPVTDEAVAPTCTETGLTEGSHCSVCDVVLVEQQEVPALGHTPVTDNATAPTCTETGLTEGSHCSVCDMVLVEQERIPALGHTPVTDAAATPTCLNTGLTEGSHCSVCDETLDAQEVIPALGHDLTHFDRVEALFGVPGNIEYWYCSRCNKYYKDAACTAETTADDLVIPARNYYLIHYELSGGTNSKNNPEQYKPGQRITLRVPTRTGYTFAGWYADAECEQALSAPEITAATTGDLTFYAKWERAPYGITFNANGGKGKMTAVSGIPYGAEYTLPANAFTLKGYAFTGWSLSANGSTGIVAGDGDTIVDLAVTPGTTITLYAQWALAKYTVTYELFGGTNSPKNPATYTVNSAAITLQNPTSASAGCTFAGWYSDTAFKKKVTQIKKGSTGDITLYAKWNATPYTLSYVLNGGANPKTAPKTYTVASPEVTLPTPTRKGCAFMGWYEDEALTVGPVESIPTGTTGNKTFYADWAIEIYEISYVLPVGENNPENPVSYTIESGAITFKNPTLPAGVTFAGWCSDAALKKKVTAIKAGGTGDMTLHAKLTGTSYKMTYSLNGGKNDKANPKTYMSLIGDVALQPATKKGYTFTGWYKNASCTGDPLTAIENGTTGALTLYAGWEITNYSITYVLNGGRAPASNPDSYTVNTPNITLTAPTRIGCTFGGWYSDAALKKKVSSIKKGSVGDITLYAKWTDITYKVSFNANGGKGKMKTLTYKCGYLYKLPECLFTNEGLLFLGWNTKADGKGADYDNIDRVYNLTEKPGTVTLYAQWGYSVSYDLNGGTLEQGSNPSTYKPTDQIELNAPSRIGYVFKGWQGKDSIGSFVTHGLGWGNTGNLQLTASWSPVQYKIIFDNNGGTGSMSAIQATYDQTFTIPYNQFSKTSHEFTNWNTRPDGTGTAFENGQMINNLANTDGSVITLYAQWVHNYSITFDANGGSGTMRSMQLVYGKSYNLYSNQFQSPGVGYAFSNWNTKPDGSGTAYADGQSVANFTDIPDAVVTLYAQWKYVGTYIVAFDANEGSGTMSSMTLTFDTRQYLSGNCFTKKGYVFNHWTTQQDGGGVAFANCGAVCNLTDTMNATVTLYAQWRRSRMTIYYQANGATGGMSSTVLSYPNSCTLPQCGFSKSGYSFTGWNTSADGSGTSYSVGQSMTNNKTKDSTLYLYAQWKKDCVHNWVEATCTTPKHCSICGVTQGSALGHQATTNGVCPRCGVNARQEAIDAENEAYSAKVSKLNASYDNQIALNTNTMQNLLSSAGVSYSSLKSSSYYTQQITSTKSSLDEKQRQLSLLKRDSSGANAVKIAALEKEIETLKAEYTKLSLLESAAECNETISELKSSRTTDLQTAKAIHEQKLKEINAMYP